MSNRRAAIGSPRAGRPRTTRLSEGSQGCFPVLFLQRPFLYVYVMCFSVFGRMISVFFIIIFGGGAGLLTQRPFRTEANCCCFTDNIAVIHIYIYIHMYTYTHIYIYIYIYTCKVYIYVFVVRVSFVVLLSEGGAGLLTQRPFRTEAFLYFICVIFVILLFLTYFSFRRGRRAADAETLPYRGQSLLFYRQYC